MKLELRCLSSSSKQRTTYSAHIPAYIQGTAGIFQPVKTQMQSIHCFRAPSPSVREFLYCPSPRIIGVNLALRILRRR